MDRKSELKKKLERERAEEPPPTKGDSTPMRRYVPETKHIQGYKHRSPENKDRLSHYLFILILTYMVLGFL